MAKFKARARALDMLGRQQIAGVPTAINELFKNAYDAYATRVEAHLVRPAETLLIRDNGFGMTKDDFESKWLVIGTESKLMASDERTDSFRPSGMKRRPIAGEKGIGRLAIGILGAQTFVWSRALREDVLHKSVVAFVNWTAYAVPQINLEDIDVPIRELEDDSYPSQQLLSELVEEFRHGFEKACLNKDTGGAEAQVLAELSKSESEVARWLVQLQSDQFNPTTSGTTFLIQPIGPTVLDSVDPDIRSSGESRIVRELAGFSNTMSISSEDRPITAAFWDHRGEGDSTDLLGEAEFWTPKDFADADHQIKGLVDSFGTFKGTIRIFRNQAIPHIVPYKNLPGHKTDCGPFEVNLGVVQGAQRESSLDPDQYALMRRRLQQFAGVYVYRDGLRVLPYGKPDQDWLGIEERRTRQATYYFFSYRRMFGYVAVTRSTNSGLKEKAGREGFQENRAYKQLRDILEQMLQQLAADFFRGKEDEPTPFRLGIKENDRLFRARERHDRSKTKKLQEFRQSMQQVDSLLNDDVLEQSIQEIITDLRSQTVSLSDSMGPEEIVRKLITMEAEASSEINALWRNLDFSKPRGVAIGKNLDRAYDLVVERRNRVETDLFVPARQLVHRISREAAQEAGSSLNQRLRVTTMLERETTVAIRDAKKQATAARTASQDVALKVAVVSETVLAELDQRLREIFADANSFGFDVSTEEDVDRYLGECQHEIALASEFFAGALASVAEMFRSMELSWDADGGLVSTLDEAQVLDEEIEQLRDQAENELELAQLGLSVDIINHEFLGTINAIRKALKSLDSWAQYNPDMGTLRDVLKNNFNHLENFLNLFSPLRKRFNAERTSIQGTEILDYLNSIFIERLKKSNVNLEATPDFRSRKVRSFASVILPAFTNIVDNALFWLQDQPEPRMIELALDGDDWLISDNGPGIPARYRESIFSAGFTTRPGGRGLGLYIAQQVLSRNDLNLTIDDTPKLGRGTTFRIAVNTEGGPGA